MHILIEKVEASCIAFGRSFREHLRTAGFSINLAFMHGWLKRVRLLFAIQRSGLVSRYADSGGTEIEVRGQNMFGRSAKHNHTFTNLS